MSEYDTIYYAVLNKTTLMVSSIAFTGSLLVALEKLESMLTIDSTSGEFGRLDQRTHRFWSLVVLL